MDDEFLPRFAHNQTRSTPGEVVHPPEGVKRQDQREYRNGQDIEDHPANHIPFTPHDENKSLKAINSTQHDE